MLPSRALLITVLLLAAGALYQLLLQISSGKYHVGALLASGAVLGLVAAAIVIPPGGSSRRGTWVAAVVALVMLVQGVLTVQMPSLGTLREFTAWLASRIGQQLALTAGILTLGAWAVHVHARRLRFVLVTALAVGNLAMSTLVLWQTPPPSSDVLLFHKDATAALVHGVNPYSITFTNVYAPVENNSAFYSPEVQKGGRVMFGYPYPPLALGLIAPAQWLLGDPRYGLALSYALAVLLVGLTGRGAVSLSAAAILAASPAWWPLLKWGWTEPQMILGAAAVGYCGTRRPRWLPLALGLFFALKQYAVIFVPLLFLLLPRPFAWNTSGRLIGRTLAVSLAVTVPLLLWDVSAFWHSTVEIQVIQPFRNDSLSYLAMFAHWYPEAPSPSSLLAFALLLPLYAVMLVRLPRNTAGFITGVGATMTVFLFANRQAFLNYHAFSASALLVGAAVCEGIYELTETRTAPRRFASSRTKSTFGVESATTKI